MKKTVKNVIILLLSIIWLIIIVVGLFLILF